MKKPTSRSHEVNCEGLSRRSCLQLGLGSFLGGGLVCALRFSSLAASEGEQGKEHCNSCHPVGGKNHQEKKPGDPRKLP